MNLAELSVGFDAITQTLEANGGELTDELAATLADLNFAERSKLDRMVFYVKALEGEADALKKLEDEIAAKRKTKQRARESLLAYVRQYMDLRQVTELKGEVFRFQLVKSGKPPVEVLVPAEDLPREWVTVTTTPNKEVIRKYLEQSYEGNLGPMVRFGEATQSVRIY